MAKPSKLLWIILLPIMAIVHLAMRLAFSPEMAAIVGVSGAVGILGLAAVAKCYGDYKARKAKPD